MDKYADDMAYKLEVLKQEPETITFFVDWASEFLRKDPEMVKGILESVITIGKQYGYKKVEAEGTHFLGWYYYDKGQYRRAIEIHVKANNLFNEIDDKAGLSRSDNALMPNYMELGMFELAIENGLKSIELAEELGDEVLLNTVLANTCFAYIECEKYEEVRDLVKRISRYEDQFSLTNRICFCGIMCEVKIYEKQLDEAWWYAEEIWKVAEPNGYNAYCIESENLKGIIKWKMDDGQAAQYHFNKALELGKSRSFNNISLSTHTDYARYLFESEHYQAAEQMTLRGIKIACDLDLPHQLIKLYKILSECYAKRRAYKEAFEASQMERKYEQELFNLSISLSFIQLNMKTLQMKVNLYEELYKRLESVSRVGQKLTANLDIGETFESIYRELNSIVQANIFGLAILDIEGKCLDYKFFRVEEEEYNLGKIELTDENSLGAYALNNNEIIHINDVDKECVRYVKQPTRCVERLERKPASIIYCPLIVENRKIGVITIQSYIPYAYTQRDVSTLKLFATYAAIAIYNGKLFDKVRYLASFDSLTNVCNRREAFKLAEKCFEETKRTGQVFCVIMLDIDHFKHINDEYGHLMGDQALVKMAEISKSQMKATDFIGRYGGEEFIIFLPNTSLDQTIERAEKIRQDIRSYTRQVHNKMPLAISVSLGIYEFDGSEANLDEGIKKADEALYQAKEQGRDRVVYYKKE